MIGLPVAMVFIFKDFYDIQIIIWCRIYEEGFNTSMLVIMIDEWLGTICVKFRFDGLVVSEEDTFCYIYYPIFFI